MQWYLKFNKVGEFQVEVSLVGSKSKLSKNEDLSPDLDFTSQH